MNKNMKKQPKKAIKKKFTPSQTQEHHPLLLLAEREKDELELIEIFKTFLRKLIKYLD